MVTAGGDKVAVPHIDQRWAQTAPRATRMPRRA